MSDTIASNHIVVDGSNIATEGREMPSLAQLNEAVTTFMELHPDAQVTVVVDATFGHRIDASERPEFDAGVANNELVAPPAGAVGRGDAFVLTIARRVGATVLSNDSFQEFHAEHEWLFDEGRLVGGKPVPHVGWVFVARTPVRGPKSKKATRDAKRKAGSSRAAKASPMASQPMPVPTAPPPGKARASVSTPTEAPPVASAPAPASGAASTVNELLPFLEFIGEHPVGTAVSGVVESYSSHGAYVRVGELAVYVPLRLMSDPPPRSARKVLRLGDEVTVVIAGTVPERRSIDAGLPGMVPGSMPVASQDDTSAARARTPKKVGARRAATSSNREAKSAAAPTRTAAKKAAAKKAATKKAATKKAATKTAATKKATAKKAATKTTATKKVAAKKAAAKTIATKKAAAKKAAKKSVAATRTTRG